MPTPCRTRRLPASLALLLLASVVTVPVQAQTGYLRRTLGDVTFMGSTLLGDPFPSTYVRNVTGAGTAVNLQVPKLNLDGGVVEYRDANIGFLSIGLDYQQAANDWLAFRVGATGGARLGTNATALLAEGITAQFGLTLGATARLVETSRFILSGTADVLPGYAYQVSLLEFAQSILDYGLDSAESLVNKETPYKYRFGAQAAYAVNDWLGLQGVVTYGPAKNLEGQKDPETRIGGALNIDFDAIGPAIGVLLGYLYTDAPAGERVEGAQNTFNVGVFYTGHKRFVVGLDILSTSAPQSVGDKNLNVMNGRLVLRYDFR